MLETPHTFRKQDSATAVFQEIIRLRNVFVWEISEILLPIYASNTKKATTTTTKKKVKKTEKNNFDKSIKNSNVSDV